MSNGKKFDNTPDTSDNLDNNAGNDDYHVVVRQENLKRLYDPNCKHEQMVRDDSDTIGDTVAWVCQECGRGTFLPKTVQKII